MSYGSLTPIEGIHGGFFYTQQEDRLVIYVSDDESAGTESAPLTSLTVPANSTEQQVHEAARAYIDTNAEELWQIDRDRNPQ